MELCILVVEYGEKFSPPSIVSAPSLKEGLDMANDYVPESRKKEWPQIRKELETKRIWADEESGLKMSISLARKAV